MKKEDIVKLWKAIQTEKVKGTVKFRYSLLKIENDIKNEIEALEGVEKDINDILEPFYAERGELIKSIGIFDESKNTYVINPKETEKVTEFNEKIKPIQEKYKTEIEEYENKYREYIEVLKEELDTEFKFKEISLNNCPDSLETESLEIFMKFKIIK
ncbi:hypothetical protein SAMN02745134_00791 [Clostridium acidisoli DSM 12555]|uniref:Uncharacterized protein n=1 Tax=Clostridium acidisoli DSM 12555 TaxID=1121291 RepID=A0A1W1X5S3_9CLOT|nr:hypothetical protein [Clostridium acidisoli]SMC19294.1 hypothetical protein SAMN02745134_00791 [Clostridium acidisoli DSM 12555]